ncbi:ribosome-associated translation inhibitor RaiA [Caulobacter sp. D4A]|uniref:ribosome hibernation-promoting factor, HPF/YfiA family n=1 Tax=unclassified Caulobacter TaxID=2648921 RepID=UPI000D733CC5|nr:MULTISPECIES: ribosome-associated translation inhibitor RaiA [unclassified Caulobacter]PXA84513.1 ribosome-associated translation inhibitor RaiA [Caulobacter sp. D4A]PXA95046.1 ribosome-associated translation inhibitor RaiA [Caulobacter sp. D5]
MQVQISGKHVDVGEALRARVADEITLSIGKYFDRGGDADVVISKEGYAFRVDCSVKLASGQQLLSHGSGGDAHMAFDQALAKIETRIRRYKQRLKSHSIAATAKQAENAAFYVLRAPDGEEGGDQEDWATEEAHPAGAPSAMVIAETQAALKTMTVSMAVMELDLTESQAIVFRNAAHGGLSVVYRRPDGNIGWIDPERTKPLNGNGSTLS